MRKLYKLFLAPAMLYSASSSYLYAGNTNDFDLQTEMLPDGNIQLSSSIDVGSNDCLFLSYVQVLRNYESEIATDIDGTPILSRWETLWQNTAINQNNAPSPKVNVQRAKNRCIDRRNNNAQNNTWSFTLRQGNNHLGFENFNTSSLYEDAELKVSAVFVSKTTKETVTGSPFGMSTSTQTTAKHKTSTQVISLKETKEEVTLTANHNFKFPGYIKGREMPLAYVAEGNNIGCLGRKLPNKSNASSQPGPNENPALRQRNGSNTSPTYDCFYATRTSQKANEAPQVTLRDRNENDVLIMCPTSEIRDELSYTKYKADQIAIPTSQASPYLQVMAEGDPRWCNYIERAQRKWSNLHSVSNEGWMVSLNPNTNKLECVAKYNQCVNTFNTTPSFKRAISQPSGLVKTGTLVLTGQNTQTCQYKDGSNKNCPEKFSSSDHKTVNDLLKSLQFESMTRSIY